MLGDRFRTGRSVGRTVYRVREDGSEELVGCLDTRPLAAMFVDAVNAGLERAEGSTAPQLDQVVLRALEWRDAQSTVAIGAAAGRLVSAVDEFRRALAAKPADAPADGSVVPGVPAPPSEAPGGDGGLADGCPTCSPPRRETVGMVCQTCGTDYAPEGALGDFERRVLEDPVERAAFWEARVRRLADLAARLNKPMLAGLRAAAADTSPDWVGATTVYPHSARDLVKLIDAVAALRLAAGGAEGPPEKTAEDESGHGCCGARWSHAVNCPDKPGDPTPAGAVSPVPDTTPTIPDEAVRAFRGGYEAEDERLRPDVDPLKCDIDRLAIRAGLAAARPYLLAAALEELAVEFDAQAEWCEDQIGVVDGALTAASCWEGAARKTRKRAVNWPAEDVRPDPAALQETPKEQDHG